MVTSSAVVGSSAMSRRGWQASAIAIITRWRMPPDSWCGKDFRRRSASPMPTDSSSSAAWSRASPPFRPRCRSRISVICRPMVSTGLSELIGSWKTMAISLPRTARSSSSGMFSRSSPSKRTDPLISTPRRPSRPRAASDVTLLPEPDSPTMPTVAPAATSRLTPSTALTGRRPRLLKVTRRSRTSSSGAPLPSPLPGTSSWTSSGWSSSSAVPHRRSLGSRASRSASPSR